MTGNTKRATLLLLGLIVLFTMIIAASLPQLTLQPGMPLPSLQPGRFVTAQTEEHQIVSISIRMFVLVLMGILLTVAMLYVAFQLFRGIQWKLILDSLRYGLLVGVGLICLAFLIMLFPDSAPLPAVQIPVQTPQPVVTSPLGSAPPLLLWLVGIVLLATTVFALIWVFMPSHRSSPVDPVGLEAEKARRALQSGASLKDVIVQCYIQMSLAVEQGQGIERDDFMTTGEFENVLETAGIPHEPIHQLTRLFEAVRYGKWQPNAADEQMAIQCLEAIVAYSHATQGAE